MRPSGSERVEIAVIFSIMAALMALIVVGLPKFARSVRSVRWSLAILLVVSFAIVGIGVGAVARQMFISQHDLTLLLVLLGFGVVSAVGFAVAVSAPMTRDLERLATVADRVGTGDLSMSLDVGRRDEVGRLARSINGMVTALRALEAQRASDADARRAFFAAVGHDLRTPLASLRVAVEALQDGVATDRTRYLGAMEKDVHILSNLVDDLFLLARIESGDLGSSVEMVDLAELVDEAVEAVAPLADSKQIEIAVDTSHPVLARCGPVEVSRVIRNLLDNAIRHSPTGSRVDVSVQGTANPTVMVVDQGEGFAPEFVESAFDRFTKGDPARSRVDGGAGLGLAIAKGFVSAFDGEIWAEAGPGGRVGFRIPEAVN